MQDITLSKGQCHTITFQSSRIQMEFRKMLTDYFRNRRPSECKYLKIFDDNGNKIRGRDFYSVIFECNVINLKEEKSTQKIIQDFLYNQLENSPVLLEDYMDFQHKIEEFLTKIGIKDSELMIDFQSSNKTITQFIRSLEISIDSNNNIDISNSAIRNFLIKLLLKLNIHNKDVILVVTYPESDVGSDDYQQIINGFNDLKVTTLILTSHHDFLVSVPKENMFLIDENGLCYDIVTLEQELLAFDLVGKNNITEVAKSLAYVDFLEDYTLLDHNLKEFLLSNKF